MRSTSLKVFYKIFVFIISFFIIFQNSYSTHVTLLLSSRLLGGGYSFDEEGTSFGGRVNFNIIPALKWKENLLIPVYSFEYSGIKDVKELVGGGTLFQQYVTNMIYIKPVFKLFSFLKIKPKLGFTSQLLKETKDEEWGKGLFDYYKPSFCLDFELSFNENSKLNVVPSIFNVNFYNYKTLASEKYGQELSYVGKDILNFLASELSIDYKINKYMKISLYGIQKNFIDQYIIKETGEYSLDKRKDISYSVSTSFFVPIKPLGKTTIFSSLEIKFTNNNSNQNHFDVEHTKFINNFYDYNEISVCPHFNFNFNTVPLNLQFLYNMLLRHYTERLKQDPQGNYFDEK
ncbi:MAG: hypothetical protein ABDH23_03475, partial [Endomicrobiia bacterium]